MSTGFDFDPSGIANDQNNSDDDQNDEPEYPANETSDLYLTVGVNGERVAFEILKAEGFTKDDKLKITSEDDLSDAVEYLNQYSDAHWSQKLHMVWTLAKYTIGELQAKQNHFGIGLEGGYEPEDPDYPSYAKQHSDLPAIKKESLTDGEVERLEEGDIDVSELDFADGEDRPRFPVVNGERLPLVPGEEGFEGLLQRMAEIPNEPSHVPEEGEFVESSDPDVLTNPEGDDSVTETPMYSEEVQNLPMIPSEETALEVKRNATVYETVNEINLAIGDERSHNNRTSVIDRLEQRRRGIVGGDVNESDSDESATESNDSDDDGDYTVEQIEEMLDVEFNNVERDAFSFRVDDKGQNPIEVAKDIASV